MICWIPFLFVSSFCPWLRNQAAEDLAFYVCHSLSIFYNLAGIYYFTRVYLLFSYHSPLFTISAPVRMHLSLVI
jgi:hypothetical protein